jgi:hypothetical protein
MIDLDTATLVFIKKEKKLWPSPAICDRQHCQSFRRFWKMPTPGLVPKMNVSFFSLSGTDGLSICGRRSVSRNPQNVVRKWTSAKSSRRRSKINQAFYNDRFHKQQRELCAWLLAWQRLTRPCCQDRASPPFFLFSSPTRWLGSSYPGRRARDRSLLVDYVRGRVKSRVLASSVRPGGGNRARAPQPGSNRRWPVGRAWTLRKYKKPGNLAVFIDISMVVTTQYARVARSADKAQVL